jgi:hypothetical protein
MLALSALVAALPPAEAKSAAPVPAHSHARLAPTNSTPANLGKRFASPFLLAISPLRDSMPHWRGRMPGVYRRVHRNETGYLRCSHPGAFASHRPRIVPLKLSRRNYMAKLALVYGMRLFPADEVARVEEATLTLKDGRTARVTMHVIEGSKEEIQGTLGQSVEAFFDLYPEI